MPLVQPRRRLHHAVPTLAAALHLAVLASAASAQAVTGATRDALADTAWQLVRFQGRDDSVLTPDDRTKYTLAFDATGGVAVRLDCNRGRATWTSSGPNALEFGPLALTRALCPDDSLHDHIVRQWENIRSDVLKDGHLFRSASGARYEGDDVLFWEARGEATVSWMGVHSICRRR